MGHLSRWDGHRSRWDIGDFARTKRRGSLCV
jgi:hypothetical protein